MQCSTGCSNRALQHTIITLAHRLFLAAMLHCCLIIIILREVHYGLIDSHFVKYTPLHSTYWHTHWMFRTAQCNILEKDIMLWWGTYIKYFFPLNLRECDSSIEIVNLKAKDFLATTDSVLKCTSCVHKISLEHAEEKSIRTGWNSIAVCKTLNEEKAVLEENSNYLLGRFGWHGLLPQ